MPALLGTRRVPYLGGAWTPARLPGLVLWLNASGIGQADNTSVARWPDQSGLHNDAVQGTVAHQPTYLAAGINGSPALQGDGVDDSMLVADAPSLRPPFVTVWAVVRALDVTSFEQVVCKRFSAASDPFNSYGISGKTSNAPFWEGFVSNGTTGSLTNAAATAAYDTASSSVLLVAYDGANVAFYVNGAPVATAARTGAIGYSALGVNLFFNPSNLFGHVRIGQVGVVGRAVTGGERAQLTAYLGQRYGIAVTP